MIENEKLPSRHSEIIESLLNGIDIPNLQSTPEGSYTHITQEAYAANFITCPCILIEEADGSFRCLHITFDELINALEHKKFSLKPREESQTINFSSFETDIKNAKKIRVLLSESESDGNSRSKKMEKLQKKISELTDRKDITYKSVRGNQFQLVITQEGVSIWRGSSLIDLLN